MSNDDEINSAINRPTRDAERLDKVDDVLLNPLSGWTTATLPGDYVMVGIEYLTQPPAIEARILRLAMTRARAAELSRALDQIARSPHVERPENPN